MCEAALKHPLEGLQRVAAQDVVPVNSNFRQAQGLCLQAVLHWHMILVLVPQVLVDGPNDRAEWILWSDQVVRHSHLPAAAAAVLRFYLRLRLALAWSAQAGCPGIKP